MIATAITLSLLGSLGVVENEQVVSAEERVLTLGEGINIVSTGEEIFSFTAPDDGIYYFYSESSDCDPYATLTTDSECYENDDCIELEFSIGVSLSQGEECQLTVNSYATADGMEYETTIYVCDEETATSTIGKIDVDTEHFVELGQAYEFNLQFMNVIGEVVDELPT